MNDRQSGAHLATMVIMFIIGGAAAVGVIHILRPEMLEGARAWTRVPVVLLILLGGCAGALTARVAFLWQTSAQGSKRNGHL